MNLTGGKVFCQDSLSLCTFSFCNLIYFPDLFSFFTLFVSMLRRAVFGRKNFLPPDGLEPDFALQLTFFTGIILPI
jgi:hypothetical protein